MFTMGIMGGSTSPTPKTKVAITYTYVKHESIVPIIDWVGVVLINPTKSWLNQIFQNPIWIDSEYGVELSYKAYMYDTSELAPTIFSLYSYTIGKPQ